MSDTVTDAAGLPLTTDRDAAASYRRGIRHLLAGEHVGARRCLAAALTADPLFALGHAASAVAARHDEDLSAASRRAAAQAVVHATRRERQHVDVIIAALTDDAAKALALGIEHLVEYPADMTIRQVVSDAVSRTGDVRLHGRLLAALAALGPVVARTDATD